MLQETLSRDSAERAAFLAEACGADGELRREVESLLGFHDRAENFIETPPSDMAADWLAAKESRAGQTIGHYQLIRRVGRGGIGEVYLARDTQLGRQVALKLSQASLTQDAARVRRFRQEARAASSLNDPKIPTIYEAGQEDSTAAERTSSSRIRGRTDAARIGVRAGFWRWARRSTYDPGAGRAHSRARGGTSTVTSNLKT